LIKSEVEKISHYSLPLPHKLSDGIDFKLYPLKRPFVVLERKLLCRDDIKPGDSFNDEFGTFLSKDDDLQL